MGKENMILIPVFSDKKILCASIFGVKEDNVKRNKYLFEVKCPINSLTELICTGSN